MLFLPNRWQATGICHICHLFSSNNPVLAEMFVAQAGVQSERYDTQQCSGDGWVGSVELSTLSNTEGVYGVCVCTRARTMRPH